MKKNFILLWLRDALFIAGASLTSNSVFSAFFLEKGLSESTISNFFAWITLTDLTASLLFSGAANRSRNLLRSSSVLAWISGLLTAAFALFCTRGFVGGLFLACVIILGAALSVSKSIRNVFDYKIPCEVIERSSFRVYQSIGGILSGAVGVLAGLAVSALYTRMDVLPVTAIVMIAGGLCFGLAAIANSRLTVLYPEPPVETASSLNILKTSRDILSDRVFRRMLLPNFLRGFGMGAVSVLSVLASYALDLNASQLSIITVCTYLATLIGCALYGVLSKRLGAPLTTLLGAVGFCLLIPAFSGGSVLFFVLYSLSYLGYNIVNYCIPEIVFRSTDPDRISAVQCWRMVLTSLGITISSSVFGALMHVIPAWVIVLIGAGSTLYCALAYYFQYRRLFYDLDAR